MNRVASFIIALHFRYPFVRQLLWACCIVITAGVVFLAGFKGSRVDTLPVGWEKSFTVSQPAIAAKNIHLASRGNFIAAVYEGVEKRAHKIYAVLSFNGGKSFLQPVVIADVAPDIDHLPRVAVSGTGHVAVVWQNLEQDDSNTRVFYSLSMDMGASWSPPVRVFMPSDFEMLPQILYDDRNVMHLFYHGHSKNVFNLYHAVSADEKTFDAPRALAGMEELRGAFFPAVSVSRSDIYVVWQGKGEMRGVLSDDLYYMHSGNYGKSWGTPEKITRSAANDAAPSLFMYRDVLYCAYQNNDERSWAIKLWFQPRRHLDEADDRVSDKRKLLFSGCDFRKKRRARCPLVRYPRCRAIDRRAQVPDPRAEVFFGKRAFSREGGVAQACRRDGEQHHHRNVGGGGARVREVFRYQR